MNAFSRDRRWLRLEEMLLTLPLKRSRVYYLVHTNQIPHHHIGRTLIFNYDEIVAWVAQNGTFHRLSRQAS